MSKHVRKFHSEAVKRKAADTAELARLELLHADKVPRLSVESHTGGAVSIRGMKREVYQGDHKSEVKVSKPEDADQSLNTRDEYGGGSNPLYVADVKKLGPAKRWKKDAVVNQKFILWLDQKRGPKDGEDLNIGATHVIAVATVNLIEDLKIPEDYWMTLQIGSIEHRKDGLTGETWKVPVGNFTKRALYTQSVLVKLSKVLNSGQFITNDIGFSASVLFTRPERKGGKRAGSGSGQKISDQMAKESRCVCEIKNKDELCCARAIVTMREYVKHQAGQQNTFENIRQARGKNSQQVKEAKRLDKEAGVPEGPCGLEEIEQFQDYLGPQGYRIIVADAVRGGVIFKSDSS